MKHIVIKKTNFLILFIEGLNRYLGCFIDHIDNHDLEVFIDKYEHLTSRQCIFACQKQNYQYAAIQHGNECRCGQQYGKYGQVSDDQCQYSCVTLEKCGGDNRSSVYSVMNSIDSSRSGFFFILKVFYSYNKTQFDTFLDLTCLNTVVGYQGCFDNVILGIVMGVVNSIEKCISHCATNYNYAGIVNGNSCRCGNYLNQPALNSIVCNIPCERNSNDMTIDCCGGLHALSVYNVKNYR
ncbi:unnamed protein product [Rotaria sp. Silwood2]|nr:unnamed protein product [Rotaria sp. Silwood2]CAF2606752.1 unnamed protein product [Rotaria sp. Silwood2]CAF2848446.1 unnamed protein product [Rotaria sp. Silwood2]CAF3020915.1 unnamed protein product [Rotaria sp. Silwood2]